MNVIFFSHFSLCPKCLFSSVSRSLLYVCVCGQKVVRIIFNNFIFRLSSLCRLLFICVSFHIAPFMCWIACMWLSVHVPFGWTSRLKYVSWKCKIVSRVFLLFSVLVARWWAKSMLEANNSLVRSYRHIQSHHQEVMCCYECKSSAPKMVDADRKGGKVCVCERARTTDMVQVRREYIIGFYIHILIKLLLLCTQ